MATNHRRRCASARARLSRLFAGSAAVIAVAVAGPARASSTYPPLVKSHWGIAGQLAGASAQGCTLCHRNDDGGLTTVTRPFGKSMMRFGATGYGNTQGLLRALDDDRTRAVDSDGDSVSDYQELVVDHTNPNDANDFKPPPPPVDAGEGGQGGATSTGAEGGQPSVIEPPPSLPPENLPPPFEHGCAITPHTRDSGFAPLILFVACLLGRRTRRRTD